MSNESIVGAVTRTRTISHTGRRLTEGCPAFAGYAETLAAQAAHEGRRTRWFMLELARQCGNVDLSRLGHPIRFWRSLRELPPKRFGNIGFRAELVDDFHPARHYVAFLMIGFFLPYPLALAFGWLWERAEGIVLGEFSPRDVALGRLAIAHGRTVRQAGPAALPALIRKELCCG